jgi:hypothetical protein
MLSAAGGGAEDDDAESSMLTACMAAMCAATSINELNVMNNHTLSHEILRSYDVVVVLADVRLETQTGARTAE